MQYLECVKMANETTEIVNQIDEQKKEETVEDFQNFEKSSHYNANDIQVLEGLDPVRKRPGMYIGSTDERGLHHLVTEIVDNSIDEALAGYCNDIQVFLQKDGSCKVVDNGRGIPTGMHEPEHKSAVEICLTKLHAGGKFGGEGYHISGGLHGVGVSCVNALSEWLTVDVYQNGNHYYQRYQRGKPDEDLKILETADHHGTTVTFKPDDQIFETTSFNYETIRTRFREIAFLNKGITISLQEDSGDEVKLDKFHFDGGIKEYVDFLNSGKQVLFEKPIYMNKVAEKHEVEIAMQYNDTYNEVIYSYANNINTEEGGTHLVGFKNALTRIINDYGQKEKLLKDEEKLTGDDVREGLAAIISVKLTDPQFEGQTKSKLGNAEIRPMVENVVSEKLEIYLEEHPDVAKLIMDKCFNASRAREAAKRDREQTRRKTVLERNSLPGKLADCQSNDAEFCEIFIVEGDSAGGSAKQGRERKYQAILPLWGTMLNVEKAREDKVYDNEKLQPVVMALGAGFGDDFSEDKLRYHKVIIMADADVDGSHIRTLLLTFFFRYLRPLIDGGYVYIACPPRYKVYKGDEAYDASDDKEIDMIKKEHNWDAPLIQRFKGLGEMSSEQLWDTTMNPTTRKLLKVTLSDAQVADDTFTLLMGDKVEPRKEFIQDNAKLANIDT